MEEALASLVIHAIFLDGHAHKGLAMTSFAVIDL
jgi:hypothetical protein